MQNTHSSIRLLILLLLGILGSTLCHADTFNTDMTGMNITLSEVQADQFFTLGTPQDIALRVTDNSGSTDLYIQQANATAIPEPTTLCPLLGIMVIFGWMVRRRL